MKSLSLILGCLLTIRAFGQEEGKANRLRTDDQRVTVSSDTNSLLTAFRKGRVQGHFRFFFMATDNRIGLTDYYANAAGGGIKYETASLKGFQFGVGGGVVFNIGSSNLTKPDPKTNQMNRYELGLFDIGDPTNKHHIDRLEELYLKYSWRKSTLTLGKQLLNTPFINPQDGRMRPTTVGGLYLVLNEIKNTKIEAGFLYEISPRSTVEWYKVGKSIGLYPQGVNPDGTRSGYTGNLTSKGILLFGMNRKIGKKLSLKLSNLFAENIFNAVLLQFEYEHVLQNRSKLISGVQYVREDAISNGGNADPAKTYFTSGAKANVYGLRIGWEDNHWQTSFNYNRITKDGRYLIPREWGRDPFYTFLPRERNDGLGDVHASVVKAGYNFKKQRIKTQLGAGYYKLPEVTNYTLNKYGLPSYTQLNIDVRYEFNGFLKGLESELLFVYKGESGNTFGNDKYVINKVGTKLWNLVLDYRF